MLKFTSLVPLLHYKYYIGLAADSRFLPIPSAGPAYLSHISFWFESRFDNIEKANDEIYSFRCILLGR